MKQADIDTLRLLGATREYTLLSDTGEPIVHYFLNEDAREVGHYFEGLYPYTGLVVCNPPLAWGTHLTGSSLYTRRAFT